MGKWLCLFFLGLGSFAFSQNQFSNKGWTVIYQNNDVALYGKLQACQGPVSTYSYQYIDLKWTNKTDIAVKLSYQLNVKYTNSTRPLCTDNGCDYLVQLNPNETIVTNCSNPKKGITSVYYGLQGYKSFLDNGELQLKNLKTAGNE